MTRHYAKALPPILSGEIQQSARQTQQPSDVPEHLAEVERSERETDAHREIDEIEEIADVANALPRVRSHLPNSLFRDATRGSGERAGGAGSSNAAATDAAGCDVEGGIAWTVARTGE